MYRSGGPTKLCMGRLFSVNVDKNKYAKCKKCGHQQVWQHVGTPQKCLKEPVILVRENSRSRSRSPPQKSPVIEMEGDTDSNVVKTSAKFNLTTDIKIMKPFYACSLSFSMERS